MIPACHSPLMLRFFDRYVAHYLRRRFHRVRLWGSVTAVEIPREMPVLIISSHASWWDVLVGYYLSRHVVRLDTYGPMDLAQLRRYRILARLGMYSIDRSSRAGMRDFFRYTVDLLAKGRAVWMTPQGEFASNWRRPVRFQAGVGHLVRRLPEIGVVPVALAYEFLDEPRPEVSSSLARRASTRTSGPSRWPSRGSSSVTSSASSTPCRPRSSSVTSARSPFCSREPRRPAPCTIASARSVPG